jgi:hypothetical protein
MSSPDAKVVSSECSFVSSSPLGRNKTVQASLAGPPKWLNGLRKTIVR